MADEKKEKKAPQKPQKEKGQAKGQDKGHDKKAKGDEQPEAPARPVVPARMAEKYKSDVIPTLMKRFNYGNVNEVPRIQKIAINMGIGAASQDAKLLEAAVRDL